MLVRRIVEKILYRTEQDFRTATNGKKVYLGFPRKTWRTVSYIVFHHWIVSSALFVCFFVSAYAFVHGLPNLFQRMGAFTIAAGVFFQYTATARRKDEMEAAAINDSLRVSKSMQDAQLRAHQKSLTEYDQRGVLSMPSMPAPRLGDEIVKRKNRSVTSFATFEIFLIGMGTIQAAFGDWIINLISCGEITCSS